MVNTVRDILYFFKTHPNDWIEAEIMKRIIRNASAGRSCMTVTSLFLIEKYDKLKGFLEGLGFTVEQQNPVSKSYRILW